MKNILRTSFIVVGLVLTFALNRLSAQSITYGRSFDMTDGVTYSSNYNMSSQESFPQGAVFNGDGTKLFVIGNSYDEIYSYTLTTPYELSGGVSFDGSPLSVATEETSPSGMAFSDNGLKLFVVGNDGDEVNQYSLSIAYDITSTVTHQGFYDISSQTITPTDIAFSSDGSKMFITAGIIYQYSLSAPFDITGGAFTNTYDGSFSTLESSVQGVGFSADGKKMFVVGWTNDKVYQYSLSSAYTVTSGATYDGIEYSVAGKETFPNGIVFNPAGTRFFIVGPITPGIVQYDIFEGGFKENDSNDGSVVGSLHFTLSDEIFNHAGATLTPSVDYTINNLPAGLTPTLSVSDDGLSGNLLLSGKATTHQATNNIASLQFTFTNAAFEGGSAAGVANAVGASSGFGIEFDKNYPQLFYGDVFDLSGGATFGGSSIALTTQEASPVGLAFSSNGQKMFIVGSSSDKVHQYSLAVPFKVSSGVTYDGTPFSVSTEDSSPSSIAFSKDGSKMFISGATNKRIYQYSLNSPFDVTGGGDFDGSYHVLSYENSPTGITFNSNGRKMYIVGSSGDEVNQFTLSSAYDITKGVSHDGLFSISSEEGGATGVSFSYDGKKMFIVGVFGLDVNQYSLTTPFDVTGEVLFDGNPFSVGTQETQPSDLAFSADGSTLFVVGTNGDDVNSYQLPVGDFTETSANDGTVEGSIKISISDDKFTNAGGNLTSGTHYSISNLPSGLSSEMAVAADGMTATLTLSGTVANHQNINDLSSLTFTFENGAFVSGNRSLVAGAFAANSNLGIDFEANVEVTFGNAFSLINGAAFNNNVRLSAASADEFPKGVTFNTDGTRMYVVGQIDKKIYQYSVSTPFRPDLGYGTGFTPLSVSSEDAAPADVAFSSDGLKMFVLGVTNKRIYEYGLTTAFNVSSGVSYSGSFFSVSGLDTAPTSMTFSPDGSKVFLSGSTNDKVYQINLATPYAIATASSSGNFVSVSAQETNPQGVRLNPDGTRMFVFGTASDAIHQYSLQNPFDLSSGVTASNLSFNISAQDGNARGFTLAGDGKSFIISAFQNLYVYSLAKDGFKELVENDGNITGRLVSNVHFDTFTNAGGTLSTGTHYSLSEAPTGLTPVMTVAGDGNSVTLTFTGTATNHQDVNDIDEIEITFTNAAFTNSDAADVLNAVNGATGFGVDFNDNIPALAYGSRLDLATDSPKLSSTYDVTGETSSSLGMSFSNNGMSLFIADYTNQAIYQYNLTTPFDISSGVSYSGHSFDVSNQEPQPTDVDFNADGTKMYVSGGSDDLVQYSLSVPFDLSGTVTLDGIFDLGNDASPSGVTFSRDGSKLYMIGSQSDKIFQYSLSMPFDVTTGVTYDETPFAVTNYNYTDIDISEDGRMIFLTNSSYPGSTQTRQFDLTVPFDIGGGVTAGGSFNFFKYNTHAQDIHLSPDGKKMFMLGGTGIVYEFDLPIDGFREVTINDGAVEGDLLISITDEQFSNAGGQLTHGADFTIQDLPSGLTPVLNVAASGKTATLTLTGVATAHQNVNDLANIQFTFNNSAFAGGSAAAVANASNTASNRSIDFRDNQPSLSYGNILDMTYATSGGAPLDVSSQDAYPTGLAFSSDGMKLFVLGGNNSSLYQYNLTTAYDISTGVTHDQTFDLSTQVSDAQDLAFSTDGMRMFVLDNSNYEVFQYNLSTAFDITSGVTYSGYSFNFESYDTSVYGFAFSADGTKMIIAGTNENDIFQFTLSGAFDLSTAPSFDGNSLNTTDVASPTGLAYSQDGRYLIMTEDNNDYEVVRYILNVPFDITGGATFDGNFFSLDAFSIYGTGITIKPDGSSVFVTDEDNSSIQQFNIDLGGFAETGANDGALTGEMNVFLVDDKFSSAGSSLSYGTDYTITNLPGGLVADLAVAADGYSAVLSFTGKASVHQNATDIDGLVFTFNNSAFVNSNAADVNNAVSYDSHVGIDFLINTENDILSFVLTQQTGPATIDDVNHTVIMEVVAGTSLTSLAPTITLSDGATSNPVSGMSQNYSSMVTYTVTAEDGTYQSWEVTITEQQVAPTDIMLSALTIDETNNVGDVIGTFTSVDGNTSQTHLYTFIAGDGDADNGSFTMLADALKAGEMFDFETKSEYLIRVQTNDQNGGLFEKAFVITINDVNEAPTGIQLSANSINESTASGTVIGSFATTDEDAGQAHTYSLVSGTDDTGNASFSITGSQLKTAAVLDFETQNSYTIRVQTSDGNGGSYEEVFTININDLPAQVTSLDLDNQSVMENLEAGTVVGNLSTTGEDLSGSYTYTLVAGGGSEDNASFSIAGSQFVTAESFDFETDNSYSVRIKTDDGNGHTFEASFTITIEDEAESTDANILAFSLTEQSGEAVIDITNHTVAIEVVYGTDVTSLIPTISISASASISPQTTTAQDFTGPVVYTVTAEEGNTQQWTVTVTVSPNSANEILTFVLAEQTADAAINTNDHTVAIGVPYGTDVTALTPTVTVSDQASIIPASGTAQDFTSAVVFEVTAGNGSAQDWTVTVNIAPNTAKNILSFSLAEQTDAAIIDATNHTVNIEVATGTSVAALVPTITVSDQASISPGSGVAQDFSTAVAYTVTAGDGSTQAWTVSVSVKPAPLSSAKDILTFSLPEQTAAASIDATAHTVAIEVAAGTVVTSLTPTITISAAASISPGSGVAQDFTNAVVYTVTAEDASTQAWTVTVTVTPAPEPLSSANDILTFELAEATGAATIDATAHTIAIEVAAGTDVSSLSPTITVSAAASISPSSEAVQDFTNAVVYTVTAEDGSTQAWTVTITIEGETTTGVADLLASISVYPNPTIDYVQINGLTRGTSIQLIGIDGLLLAQPAEATDETAVVNMKQLQSGMYILRVSADGVSKSFRVIKN